MDVTGAIVEMGPLGLLLALLVALLAIGVLLALFALYGIRRRLTGIRVEIAKTREALTAELRQSGATGFKPSATEIRPQTSAVVVVEDEAVSHSGRRPLVARRD